MTPPKFGLVARYWFGVDGYQVMHGLTRVAYGSLPTLQQVHSLIDYPLSVERPFNVGNFLPLWGILPVGSTYPIPIVWPLPVDPGD